MSNKMDEQIIVSKRSWLFAHEELAFQGLEKDPERIQLLFQHLSESYEVMRRGDAEINPLYKQPIGYAFIRRGNEIFLYKRLSGSGETRLHTKLSIGVGGHTNVAEGAETFEDILMENLNRELEEELDIEYSWRKVNPIGFINDDTEEVSKVHIGLLVAIDLDESATVEVRETDQLEGQWVTLEQLKQPDTYSKLESWSQIAVDALSK